MRERRKFIRIPEDSQIYYEVLHLKKTGTSITKNISQGGIRFFVNEFIPQNSVLKIHLPMHKVLLDFKPVAKVAWIKEGAHREGYEIGVEFMNMTQKDTERLAYYIENYLKQKKTT